MFPESDIAKSFTCGKDKTGYIIRFGLASFFKKQLVDGINKAGPFVLMFAHEFIIAHQLPVCEVISATIHIADASL